MKITTVGACIFCGQANWNVNYDDCTDQDESDGLATRNCTCPDGKRAANRFEEIRKSKERIINLFGGEAEALGLNPVKSNIIDIMNAAVELIVHGEALNLSMQITGTTKTKISITAKDTVRVERTETNKYQREE